MVGGNSKADTFIEKNLLELVEKQGKSRDEVVLVEICDSQPDVFGKPGSTLRRDIQEQWKNIRRRSTGSCARCLARFGIAPGAGTRSSLASDNNSSDDDTSVVTHPSVAPSSAAPAPKSKVKTASAVSSAELEQLTSVLQNLQFTSPPKFQSPMKNFSSPAPALQLSLSNSSSEWSAGEPHRGSKENPIEIIIDEKHPERHLVFDIQHVPRIEHNGWAREGCDIRTMIGIEDVDAWNASMDPDHGGRVMLIQGRSRPSDFDKLDECHRHDFCKHTKSAHENTKDAIHKDPLRHSTWHKSIWNETINLDNGILSGDPTQVEKHTEGIEFKAGGVETCSVFVHWRIAKKNGGHRIDSGNTTSTVADAFL